MVISFVLCWIPIGGAGDEIWRLTLNTVWTIVNSMVFFASYTMCLIAFYGSLSTVCENEPQRLRVSGYKSFFDTISYCLVYALVPVILSGAKIQINTFVFICSPLMLSMIIPLFLIKEGAKYGYPENRGMSEKQPNLKESVVLTFKNRTFRRWLYVNCCTFFGLQMFLSGMNGLIIGGMGLNGGQMAVLNTFAFAPVPLMLYLFNKVKARYGVRLAYQSCLLMFAVAIMSFFFGSRFVLGEANVTAKMIIGIVGSLAGSWSIGVFFMMPYLAPAQISSVEERLTGKNHSAMYFAGNAVATSIVGAISGSLVYEYVKNLFICKDKFKIVWAQNSEEAFRKLFDMTESPLPILPEQTSQVFNLGNLMVPFIVTITCVLGFFIAFKLPKDFTPTILAKDFKDADPSLDISEIEKEEVKEEKSEIIFVQVGLWVLTGSIFGFFWSGFLVKSIKAFGGKMKGIVIYLLSALVPFGSIYTVIKLRREILRLAEEKGAKVKLCLPLLIILSVIFPLLPVNPIALAILQHSVNKLHEAN